MFKTGFEPKTLVKLEETCSIIFALQRDFQFIYRKQSQFDAWTNTPNNNNVRKGTITSIVYPTYHNDSQTITRLDISSLKRTTYFLLSN